MTGLMISRRIATPLASAMLVVAMFAGGSGAQTAPPDLQRIRALYESASYDEAVQTLDAAENASILSGEDLQGLLQYRALCLLALNRDGDAERAVEQILTADPLHQLPAGDAPPRLVTTFDRVRARIAPRLAREQYESAKALYDSRNFSEASKGFERVVQIAASAGRDQPRDVADLSTLAGGFLELSRAQATAGTAGATARRIFTSDDHDVVPPVAIRQEVPAWRQVSPTPVSNTGSGVPREGRLEIVIGPTGDVQEAALITRIDPVYDAALLRAAKNWKYQPAMKDGHGVSYRRAFTIRLVPPEGGGASNNKR
jgi:hypothetical protein